MLMKMNSALPQSCLFLFAVYFEIESHWCFPDWFRTYNPLASAPLLPTSSLSHHNLILGRDRVSGGTLSA